MSNQFPTPNKVLSKAVKPLWQAVVFGLTFPLASVVSFAQTASYHDHNIFHGAGTAFVNTSPQAQAVGDGGVLRAQLIWQVTPGQTKGADLDIHAKLPNGAGQYTVTQFDPVGVLPGTPQKTPPFGNPNTATDGNQQVNWVNRQVVFSNGQAVASLDQDNRTGVGNSPSGALVENIYIKGATVANPNNIPSGTYQFAVHNYNQTKLADPTATYALWITTNGKVGVRSEGHYRGTGQDPANPGLPVYVGTLSSEGQSSRIFEIDIVNPDHDPHASGVAVVDRKRNYLNAWHAEQARLAEIRRQATLNHQDLAEPAASRIDLGGCPPPSVCPLDFRNAYYMAWGNPNQGNTLLPIGQNGVMPTHGVLNAKLDWSDIKPLDITASTMEYAPIRLGSNLKIYTPTANGGLFSGNGSVSVVKLGAAGKAVGAVGIALEVFDQYGQINDGVKLDGGVYGNNAKVQTAGAIGSLSGGIGGGALGGAIAGAYAGLVCGLGAPACSAGFAIVGAVVGGVIGSFGGEYIAETTAEKYQTFSTPTTP